ncbi:MAG: formylglycine-generating enzyme family protein [Treponema sp.]|nr:formylglycine-generating enzyme family protein [Treponema sp.]
MTIKTAFTAVNTALALCFIILFAGCGDPAGPTTSTKGPFDLLETAINDAKSMMAGVASSIDGSDVDENGEWVPTDIYNQLAEAIETAEFMFATGAAPHNAVVGMINTLVMGQIAFLTAISPGQYDGYTRLTQLIGEAEALLDGITASLNGSDVDEDKYWVSSVAYAALEDVIDDAKAITASKNTATSEVENMIIVLGEAKNEFSNVTPQLGSFADRRLLRELIADTEDLLENVPLVAESAATVPRGEHFTPQALHDALEIALANAKDVVDGTVLAEITAKMTALSQAIDAFETADEIGTMPPDVTEIQILLATVGNRQRTYADGAVTRNVIQEPATNNIPGLFIDFGHFWVLQSAAEAIDTAETNAQTFVANIATTGTAAEAVAMLSTLSAAHTDYVVREGLGLVFIEVPAGRFTRYAGTTTLNTTGYETRITNPYRIAKYEITVGQWEAVMGTGWPGGDRYDSSQSNSAAYASYPRERFPAVRLTWYDVLVFSNKLSTMAGRTRIYNTTHDAWPTTDAGWLSLTVATIPQSNRPSGFAQNGGPVANTVLNDATQTLTNTGFRMPSGHEWQWAAMGAYSDTTATYTTGSAAGGLDTRINTTGYRKAYAGQPANATNNSGDASRAAMTAFARVWWNTANPANAAGGAGVIPVGLLTPNELGIHDMSGNAFEWCFDRISAGNNQGLPDTSNPLTDYVNSATGGEARKLGHGGDWYNFANGTGGGTQRPSIWNRTGLWPAVGYDQSGIRLVTRGANPTRVGTAVP